MAIVDDEKHISQMQEKPACELIIDILICRPDHLSRQQRKLSLGHSKLLSCLRNKQFHASMIELQLQSSDGCKVR